MVSYHKLFSSLPKTCLRPTFCRLDVRNITVQHLVHGCPPTCKLTCCGLIDWGCPTFTCLCLPVTELSWTSMSVYCPTPFICLPTCKRSCPYCPISCPTPFTRLSTYNLVCLICHCPISCPNTFRCLHSLKQGCPYCQISCPTSCPRLYTYNLSCP